MGISARLLGYEYGLNPEEMNFVLKEEGFHEKSDWVFKGGSHGWELTDKGKEYGTPSKNYPINTWDDEIANVLDVTEDRKREIRQAISTAKQRIAETKDMDIAFRSEDYFDEHDDEEDAYRKALVFAVGAVLVAVSAFGVYKAAPYIKRFWKEKAVPNIKSLMKIVTGKTEQDEAKTDTEDSTDIE